jgi:hypothetical protein
VVPVSFHDFFASCATVAGALIGLLFVAISVSPDKLTGDRARAEHQVRAGAAFSALVNTLVIALLALLPSTNLGEVGIVVSGAGLGTTFGLIVLLYREHQEKVGLNDVTMFAILLTLYVLQLVNSLHLDGAPRTVGDVINAGLLAIGFFLFGIARSWQLVGARNVSLTSTVAAILHRAVGEGQPLAHGSGDRSTPQKPSDQSPGF